MRQGCGQVLQVVIKIIRLHPAVSSRRRLILRTTPLL
jgi:hypothetical protein